MISNMYHYVLAIDPALSTTGYAVIAIENLSIKTLDKIQTSSKMDNDERIVAICNILISVSHQYDIKEIVLEDGFLGKNPKTAMQLATLRGAIIGIFGMQGCTVNHMFPSEIRHTLGIGGNASKEDVAKLIGEIYKDDTKLKAIGAYSDKQNKDKTSDIYDAVSIGLAYCKKKNLGSI